MTQPHAVSAQSDTWAGQAAYTPFSLRIYDALVLGLSSRCFWRCPSSEMLAVYDANVSANHLDVGVATGYYLDACRFPVAQPRLGLLDLNPLCLETAAQRVARYRPETYQADVLAPIDLPVEPFDSLGITFLLHCLPGPMARKAAAFANLKPLLNPGARVFGSTILGRGVPHNALGRRLMALYNSKGIFGNAEDDPEGLRAALSAYFDDVELRLQGAVALFTARA
ncbi:class I SAM-dependent methyltransferase [Pelagibius marinus]|uniref:class I SAM-dependent methyltransferase n=1 Tax=Pelagibius marinus TaxID=2762760 RepID=UPI001872CAFE|nr:class I SAM-dependent methyltransferase [Pelagibius marinus]